MNFSWDFYSKLMIISFSTLQIARWRILPQFMDIFYHILTAWGFIQAGGYSGWDFWQYAPVGRTHIYPPFFHIVLAFLINSGIDKIILIKLFETATPIILLVTLWYFVKKNYSSRLAFFSLLMLSSSSSFYGALLNYLPATMSMIFGFLAFNELFKGHWLRPALLLALCFYTHIGMSWFFALSVILYGLFDKRLARQSFYILICALALSAPVIYKQLTGLKYISITGISNEKYFCEFKPVDYLLACFYFLVLKKKDKRHRLFLAFLLASLIFLPYPYRFINAQGYLPIIFLSAATLDYLCSPRPCAQGRGEKFWNKGVFLKLVPFFSVGYVLLFSPTVIMEKDILKSSKPKYRVAIADSALANLLLSERNQRISSSLVWFPDEYMSLAQVIKQNSDEGDIIYSTLYLAGITVSSMSERPTANGLFPEIAPSEKFDPILAAKIIIVPQDEDMERFNVTVRKYHLKKIGENKLFIVYKNFFKLAKVHPKKAAVPFKTIYLILALLVLLFLFAGKIENFVSSFFIDGLDYT